ncbi:hypothetical protein lerEdw1_005195 [Lerista edwardsae]|nr:hypothetical protein lerEdw1_005195 [Lerista edwardsae]
MSHNRPKNPSPIPEGAWESGLKEMNETWKGGIACLGVAVFFVMTIGIIYWQVVDQPNKNWILRGSTSGLIWERRSHSLILQTLSEEKTLLEIYVGSFPDMGVPFVKNLCWLNKTEFCYTWEAIVDLRISLEASLSSSIECYGIKWTPLHCLVKLKDCFSMANISWYGGGSVSTQHWPLNNMNMKPQLFIISNLTRRTTGYGPVLERYLLGSTGVTVTMASDIPIFFSVERHKQFCLENSLGTDMAPLQYTVCVAQNITGAHQEVGSQLSGPQRTLPNTDLLRLPVWKYYGATNTTAKLERGLRSFFNKLQRHHLGEGLIALSEHSTMLLYDMVPLLTKWKGQLSAQLNVTSQAAVLWYMDRVSLLKQRLGAEYVVFEGGESNPFIEQAIPPPLELRGDKYICTLASMAATLGDSSIISAGTRSSHLPLFVQMNPRRSDWSFAGLKGIIPSVLHYSLLGYNFFIPDAIGGTLASEFLIDDELYIRWLQIVTFLPVMSFSTPPWICCDDWVLNLTLHYIQKHKNLVVPLIEKYSKEWLSWGYPIFRPVWWLSPTESVTFTIDDEFLIGDEVLVAPITEQGQSQRDIYLPREGQKWMDTNTAEVFDGGTFLRNYSVTLLDVPVFVKTC